MSSESHHVFLTSIVAVSQTATSNSAHQIHRNRCRIIAAAEKYAYGTATMVIHLHGNCTNRSFGRYSQRNELCLTIRIAAAAESTSSTRQSFFLSSLSCSRAVLCNAAIAAIPVITSSRTATLEAIQLKTLCSRSLPIV